MRLERGEMIGGLASCRAGGGYATSSSEGNLRFGVGGGWRMSAGGIIEMGI